MAFRRSRQSQSHDFLRVSDPSQMLGMTAKGRHSAAIELGALTAFSASIM
jgi:hypothetical protein